jgi:hypothetical protein
LPSHVVHNWTYTKNYPMSWAYGFAYT